MWSPSFCLKIMACAVPLAASFQISSFGYRSDLSSPSSLAVSRRTFPRVQSLHASASETSATTLTEATTWNLRLVLQNLPTAKGKMSDQIFAIRAQFIEEEGYEPPQGIIRQLAEIQQGEEELKQPQFTVTNSRWILSEDPEDRKDSLWIWGLFKDPLYPFLLLQMEVDEIQLPGDEKDSIPPLKLFAQINHKRENGEVVLTSGADLKIKKKETVKADPFGAATVDIFEDVSVGKLQLQPITTKS